jgi:hypothetical protein
MELGLDQKQELQQVLFPEGLRFDGEVWNQRNVLSVQTDGRKRRAEIRDGVHKGMRAVLVGFIASSARPESARKILSLGLAAEEAEAPKTRDLFEEASCNNDRVFFVQRGLVVTPKKIAALRKNAKLAGRKPKFQVGDAARPNAHAPSDYRGRTGLITELGPGKSEYRVEFEDGRQPTTGYLKSRWLESIPSAASTMKPAGSK